jgi:hypothetical protein
MITMSVGRSGRDPVATERRLMMVPDSASEASALREAARELEAAIHDARVAFDCIGLGEIDRAHTSALTARVALDAAVTAIQAVLRLPAGQSAATNAAAVTKLIADR